MATDDPIATFSALFEKAARHLPEPEAADRVALTVRFLNSGLARWERDNQEDAHRVAPLTSFTLILCDLAVAMLDAPSSVPPESDAYFGHPHLVGHQALPAARLSRRRLRSGGRSGPTRCGALMLRVTAGSSGTRT